MRRHPEKGCNRVVTSIASDEFSGGLIPEIVATGLVMATMERVKPPLTRCQERLYFSAPRRTRTYNPLIKRKPFAVFHPRRKLLIGNAFRSQHLDMV